MEAASDSQRWTTSESGSVSVRILVADGYPDTARTLALVLTVMGQEAAVALDGPEVLRVAAVFRPEVVLMDVELPGADAFEVARQLRREAGSDGLLLVAVTGYHDDNHRRLARDAGFDDYLLKPVCPEELSALLSLVSRKVLATG
jgi:CheY-like chemotaxis protein